MTQNSVDTIESLVAALADRLQRRGHRVTVAESCTGGALAAALTDRSGSSAWFEYGFVTYSNAAKQVLLGVDAAVIAAEGAVSRACVEAMVAGALRVSAADYGVAISGIAGPAGGAPDKPVGTVWLAAAARDGIPVAACYRFDGDRQSVRQQAVIQAVSALLALVAK